VLFDPISHPPPVLATSITFLLPVERLYTPPVAPLPTATLLVPVVRMVKVPGPTAMFVPMTTTPSCRSVTWDWSSVIHKACRLLNARVISFQQPHTWSLKLNVEAQAVVETSHLNNDLHSRQVEWLIIFFVLIFFTGVGWVVSVAQTTIEENGGRRIFPVFLTCERASAGLNPGGTIARTAPTILLLSLAFPSSSSFPSPLPTTLLGFLPWSSGSSSSSSLPKASGCKPMA